MRNELSPKEIKILDLIKLGCTDKDIALQLGVTRQTIKHHLQYIFAKLGAENRTVAVVKALMQGYLTFEGVE